MVADINFSSVEVHNRIRINVIVPRLVNRKYDIFIPVYGIVILVERSAYIRATTKEQYLTYYDTKNAIKT